MEKTRTVSVELSDDDIKEAVAQWLNAQPPFDLGFDPSDVKLETVPEWRRVGIAEDYVFRVKITASKSS